MSSRIFGAVSVSSLKSFLEWEVAHELSNGWSHLWSLLTYVLAAGLYVFATDFVGLELLELLLPGIIVVDLLSPFLRIGSPLVEDQDIPRKFRASPAPLVLFAFRGLCSGLLRVVVGVLVFIGLVGLGGVSLSGMANPVYWLAVVLVIPLSVGLGGLISSVRLLTASNRTFNRLVVFGLILFGGVFLRPWTLPYGFGYLSYLTPYYYPIAVARSWTDSVTTLLLFGGVFSVAVCVAGSCALVLALRRKTIMGSFHRTS